MYAIHHDDGHVFGVSRPPSWGDLAHVVTAAGKVAWAIHLPSGGTGGVLHLRKGVVPSLCPPPPRLQGIDATVRPRETNPDPHPRCAVYVKRLADPGLSRHR